MTIRWRRTPSPFVVALIAVAIGGAFVIARLFLAADGDLSRFVVAGSVFVDPSTVDPHIHVFDSSGYDGQFYFRQALEPFETDIGTVRGIRLDQELRVSRVGYPVAAYGASVGQPGLVVIALVGVNLIAIGVIAGAGAALAVRRGLTATYGLLVASSSGLVMALARDLTEVVMVAGLVAGIAALVARRWAWATVAWTVAVLTHEQAVLVIAVYGLSRVVELIRARRWPAAPDVPWIASGLAVVSVQGVIAGSTGTLPALSSGGQNVTFPFVGLAPELLGWLTGDLAKQEVLVLPELALVVVLVVVAFSRHRLVPAEHRWIVAALGASALLATTLSRNIWVGPAELRQVVVVPTLVWVVLVIAGRPIPTWLIASAVGVFTCVAALRVGVI